MARSGTNHRGGRPKGSKAVHTLEAERGKAYIVQRYLEELEPMLKAQIKQAKKGNVKAFDVLSERALGRVPQGIANDDGKPFILQIAEAIIQKNDIDTRTESDSQG